MSVNLNENIKHYLVGKAIDLAEIVVFIGVLFYGSALLKDLNQYLVLGVVIGFIVLVLLLFNKLSKYWSEKTVPEIYTDERKTYLIIDSVTMFLFGFFLWIGFYLMSGSLSLWLAGILLAIYFFKEINKWRKEWKLTKQSEITQSG